MTFNNHKALKNVCKYGGFDLVKNIINIVHDTFDEDKKNIALPKIKKCIDNNSYLNDKQRCKLISCVC